MNDLSGKYADLDADPLGGTSAQAGHRRVWLICGDADDGMLTLTDRLRAAHVVVDLLCTGWGRSAGTETSIRDLASRLDDLGHPDQIALDLACLSRGRFSDWQRIISILLASDAPITILLGRSGLPRSGAVWRLLQLIGIRAAATSRIRFRLRPNRPLAARTPVDRDLAHLEATAQHLRHLLNPTDGKFMFGPVTPVSRLETIAHGQSAAGWMHGLPVSRHAIHMQAIDPVERYRPIETASQLRQLLRWYVRVFDSRRPDSPVTATERRVAHPLRHRARRVWTILKSRLTALNASKQAREPSHRVARAFELMVGQAQHRAFETRFGTGIHAYFKGRVGDDPTALSRFELLAALILRPSLVSSPTGQPLHRATSIRRWFKAEICADAPALLAFSTASKQIKAAWQRPQLDLTGLVQTNSGLARNLLMSQRAFARNGLLPQVRDVHDQLRTVQTRPGLVLSTTVPLNLKRHVAVHHINGDMIPQTLLSPIYRRRDDIHHIGLLLWEFDVLPDSHRLALDMLDEIWVPSRYLERIYGAATDTPVHWVGKSVETGPIAEVDLSEIGLDPDAFTFLVAFDAHSSTERKNPLASVTAFQKVFPANRHPNVHLMVKSTPVPEGHWGDPRQQMAQIRQIAETDARIRVAEVILSDGDFLSLIAQCDCVISPHRTEGFGYIPAFALTLGRPVIASDAAATSEFCTEETSFPVRVHVRPVAANESIYPVPGAIWADVDIDHLGERMREVHANPARAKNRAEAGARLMSQVYSHEAQAARYRDRLVAANLAFESTGPKTNPHRDVVTLRQA